jgi:hypothetical protein
MHEFGIEAHLPSGRVLYGGLYLGLLRDGSHRLWLGTCEFTGPADVFVKDFIAKSASYNADIQEALGRTASVMLGLPSWS